MTLLHPLRQPAARTAPRVPPWAWMLLVAALVIAPWLGTVHAALHARAPVAASATVQASAAQCADLARLFGDHGQTGDCRLYDQLSHSDGLHMAVVSLPPVVLPPVAVLAWHAGECLRRWATLFDARGPPFLA